MRLYAPVLDREWAMKLELTQPDRLYVRHMLRRIAFLLLTFSAVGSLAQPAPVTALPALEPAVKQAVLEQVEDVVTRIAFVPGVDFSKWPGFLQTHRADVDKAETDVAFARELNAVLKEFGVSHIHLSAPRAAQMRATGMRSGLGITVKKVDTGLEVTSVFPGSPAATSGLEAGDVIVEAGGKPASDTAAIRVDPGQKIDLTLKKKSGETKQVTVEAKAFSGRRPEALTWIGEDTAVLKLWTFSTGYDRKNVEALMKEIDAKAKFLVVDLRSNGGGAVVNLNHFLSMLMPNQTPIGTFISKSVADDYAKMKPATADPLTIAAWAPKKFKTNRREAVEPFTGKIAVLLNRGSASASEICAAALKESRGAAIVGSKSAGAVLASTYRQLPGGFELQYPFEDYVTIKGTRLEGHPLEPDVAVEVTDDVVQKAIDFLKKVGAVLRAA